MNSKEIITAEEIKQRRIERGGCKSCGKSIESHSQKLPSKFQMIKNLMNAAKDAIQNGLDVRSPEDIEKALTICSECPKLVNDDGWIRCGGCGCGLGFSTPDGIRPSKLSKLALKAWHCPIGKW
jgi:hypothetical protein